MGAKESPHNNLNYTQETRREGDIISAESMKVSSVNVKETSSSLAGLKASATRSTTPEPPRVPVKNSMLRKVSLPNLNRVRDYSPSPESHRSLASTSSTISLPALLLQKGEESQSDYTMPRHIDYRAVRTELPWASQDMGLSRESTLPTRNTIESGDSDIAEALNDVTLGISSPSAIEDHTRSSRIASFLKAKLQRKNKPKSLSEAVAEAREKEVKRKNSCHSLRPLSRVSDKPTIRRRNSVAGIIPSNSGRPEATASKQSPTRPEQLGEKSASFHALQSFIQEIARSDDESDDGSLVDIDWNDLTAPVPIHTAEPAEGESSPDAMRKDKVPNRNLCKGKGHVAPRLPTVVECSIRSSSSAPISPREVVGIPERVIGDDNEIELKTTEAPHTSNLLSDFYRGEISCGGAVKPSVLLVKCLRKVEGTEDPIGLAFEGHFIVNMNKAASETGVPDLSIRIQGKSGAYISNIIGIRVCARDRFKSSGEKLMTKLARQEIRVSAKRSLDKDTVCLADITVQPYNLNYMRMVTVRIRMMPISSVRAPKCSQEAFDALWPHCPSLRTHVCAVGGTRSTWNLLN